MDMSEHDADAVTIKALNTRPYFQALRTIRSQLAVQSTAGCLAQSPQSHMRQNFVDGSTKEDECMEDGYACDVFANLRDDTADISTPCGPSVRTAEGRVPTMQYQTNSSEEATHRITSSHKGLVERLHRASVSDSVANADLSIADDDGSHDAGWDPLARLTKRREELLLMHSRRFTEEQREEKRKTREYDR